MISGIARGIGGAAAKTLAPLDFCGKTATEKFIQVAEHWAVGTVSDGATGMLTTYVSERIDGKSSQEAWATTNDQLGQIWGNATITSTVGTAFSVATAPKCFVAGTMITTATGLVAIENIEPGDMVLSENPETGEIEYKTVLTTFVSETDEITHVTIRNESGIQEIIDSTPEHPFYVEGMGWVEASSLHIGMTVWFANGTKGTVEDISNEGLEEPVAVYNFKVEDFHTYFVGESGVLVHNAECGTVKLNDDGTVIVEVSKDKYPESARHTQDAIDNGQPEILTIDRYGASDRRKMALRGKEKTPGLDMDEYPPVMFAEGGANASVRAIPPSDNRGSGATIGGLLKGYPNGTKVIIKYVSGGQGE